MPDSSEWPRVNTAVIRAGEQECDPARRESS